MRRLIVLAVALVLGGPSPRTVAQSATPPAEPSAAQREKDEKEKKDKEKMEEKKEEKKKDNPQGGVPPAEPTLTLKRKAKPKPQPKQPSPRPKSPDKPDGPGR